MARSAGYSIENDFSRGLVTEATGLNFPENAVTDTDNSVFDQRGVVSRRDGIDFEPDYSSIPIPTESSVCVEYLWESVAGDGNLTFQVQQVGYEIRFYRATGAPSLSSGFVGSISLLTFALVPSGQVAENFAQFSSGLGRLVVVHPFCEPFFVTYNKSDNTINTANIPIWTRDFRGVDPQPIQRLPTITPSHLYNLINQGWDQSKIDRMRGFGGTYPSDYDVWWLYKTPDALGTEVFLTDIAVEAGILGQVDRGNSPAPKGSILLEEFYQDRSRWAGVPGIPVVTSGVYRPSTTEFFAGRIFYAGVNALDYNQKIYFSQILESEAQFGRCYQENDPTSQYSPDLLPTDGGVIAIPDAGTIYKLVAVDNNLLVFATQGVWQITGSQGIGFTATDYTTKKISSASTLSPLSFVKVDGAPVWWSLDDIYTAVIDAGSMVVKSISTERIKTYFQGIPEESKVYAKGAYNNRDKVVQWLFRSTLAPTLADKQDYTHILNVNTVTQAFYPWTIENPLTSIRGISVVKGQGSSLEREDVLTTSGETIFDLLGNPVYVEESVTFTLSSAFKYTVLHSTNRVTFAELKEGVRVDWKDAPGGPVQYKSYFIPGYRVRGQGMKKFQSNYLSIFVDNSTPQKFSFQTLWDYANNRDTGRWSSKQVLEFSNPSFDYRHRRLKLRGHGLALQFRVESIEDQDYNIIGWASFDTANERP